MEAMLKGRINWYRLYGSDNVDIAVHQIDMVSLDFVMEFIDIAKS